MKTSSTPQDPRQFESQSLLRGLKPVLVSLIIASIAAGCASRSKSDDTGQDSTTTADDETTGGQANDVPVNHDDGSELFTESTFDVDAAALGFRLYYRERVDRLLVQYNRFSLFGGAAFGTNIDGKAISRIGDTYEVVPGPSDNNLIGSSIWSVYEAYRLFGGRSLELTLIRQFEGLAYYEEVSGFPGLTARQVYAGWTRRMDGVGGQITFSRNGEVVSSPADHPAALGQEILERFFGGVDITYRENPAEFMFSFLPSRHISQYATTYSFSQLPHYLRNSNCCSSLMRTPDGNKWAGAFWGNHNSRDNLVDLSLGFLAAMRAIDDSGVSDDVRAAAARALAAGHRIGDLMQEHDGALMTFDEHNPYGTLVVGGAVRPHSDPENQDLGSASSCPMAYLSKALSSPGLSSDLPPLPIMPLVEGQLGADDPASDFECDIVEGEAFRDAYCGYTWDTLEDLKYLGVPWLELVTLYEASDPGVGARLLGSFQNDYDDVVEAMVALIHYAELRGDAVLLEDARANLKAMTNLQRRFADVAWAPTNPEQAARQRYDAALFDALGGIPVIKDDLAEFSTEEGRIGHFEAYAVIGETLTSPPLKTDEEIAGIVRAEVEKWQNSPWGDVAPRYEAEYGSGDEMNFPLRRTADGYEARGTPLEDYPWRPVENPPHASFGGVEFLEAITLCRTAPQLINCDWARLGCERPDLNDDGTVDVADEELLAAARADLQAGCDATNTWCSGGDLDRNGAIDERDAAFMNAAQGCSYSP